jgi:hypothetical protein
MAEGAAGVSLLAVLSTGGNAVMGGWLLSVPSSTGSVLSFGLVVVSSCPNIVPPEDD